MTYAELIEEVRENLGMTPGAARIPNGEIKRRLNLAMREISLEVGVPTLYIDVPSAGTITGAFTMPVRVHPEGIKYAEVVEVSEGNVSDFEQWKNREVALLSVQEANTFHPRWEDDDYSGIPFLLWSPADKDRGIQPVGITTASYRFLVHAVPEPMSEDDHEPFSVVACDEEGDATVYQSGAMPAYHRILAYFVTHELLQGLGDQRWQAFFSRYTKMREEMHASAQPATMYMPTWRSGRRVKRYA